MTLLKKISDCVLYHDPRFYASFPAVVNIQENRLLLMFRRARDLRWLLPTELAEEQIKLRNQVDHVDSRSQLTQMIFDQHGHVLEPAQALPVNPEAADQDASLLRLRNGTLLVASFSWYPVAASLEPVVKHWPSCLTPRVGRGSLYLFWGGFVRLSHDNGKSWSEHQYLPVLPGAEDLVPGKRPHYGGGIRGQAIETAREILLATYSTGSHLYISTDGGATWLYRACIADDQSKRLRLCEPALVLCPSGKVVAFMRSEGGEDQLVTAESLNNGYTWTPWCERKVIGHPFHVLPLRNGQVLLSYGYRHEPFGIRARLLDSECSNIDAAPEAILRDDGVCADVGYPWATQLDDGRIIVAYYFTGSDGVRHIAATWCDVAESPME